MVEQQETGQSPEQLPFSESTKQVLHLAEEAARTFNHNYIGTEHFLLGVIKDPVIAQHLSNSGIKVELISSAINFIIGRGERPVTGKIGMTPRSKKVIGLAIQEAILSDQKEILPEDILIGLFREGEGVAAGVLESLNLRIDANLHRYGLNIYPILKPSCVPREDKAEKTMVAEELIVVLSDPNIDAETKNLLSNTVRNSIELAKRAKPQSN